MAKPRLMIPDFAAHLACHGAAPCLIPAKGGAAVSYAELALRADAFGRRLGAGRKLVALEAAPDVALIAAYLGVLRAGHVAALLPAGDRAAMDRFRRDYAPDAVFARRGGRWRLGLDGRGGAGPAPHPDLSLVMLTSGSTGHGKGVRLSGAALAANARSIVQGLAITPADRAALVLPLHYSYGLSVVQSHLAAGASVWLAGGSVLEAGFLPALAASGATGLAMVPHGFDLLARAGLERALAEGALPALRCLTVAGGALAPPVQRRIAAAIAAQGGQFHAMYGQTEATARIALLPPALAASHAGFIGAAIPGGALSLLDACGAPIPGDGAEGELVYHGPNVMMGYAGTRADLSRGAEVTALHTGDIARREGGLYRMIGRKRRMSKIAGLRVGHDALEAALAEAGLTAAVWGDDAVLHVAAEGRGDPAPIAGRAAALAGLTPLHLRVRMLDRLPRLPSGKTDYEALRQAGADRPALPKGDVAGDVVGDVMGAFALAFHPRPVGARDSFASLGGDSLRHVELALAVERALGHLPDGWERMPLASLAAPKPALAPPLAAPLAARSVTVGTDLVLRALAILMVVVTHQTLWPLYGGAAVMVVLIGHQLARFQQQAMGQGRAGALLRPLWRVLLPYYAILAGYALAWGQVPFGSVALVSNFGIGDPVRHDRLPFLYWFVEVYAQMLLLLAALVLLGPVRRLVATRPMTFGFGLLAAGVALRFAAPPLMGLGGRQIFTLPWVFYLLALGWLAALAQGRQRRAVLAVAAAVLALVAWDGGNWYGSWIKYATVWGALALLILVPRWALPGGAGRAVLVVAASSYMIYLTHRLVPELAMAGWQAALPGWLFGALSIAGGVALGIALTTLTRPVARHAEAAGAALRLRLSRMIRRSGQPVSPVAVSPALTGPAAGNAP